MNHGITEYLLKDRTLHINIFCWQHPMVNSAEIRDVHVTWKGGARVVQLWCPPDDDE